jgi:hypothetical protein
MKRKIYFVSVLLLIFSIVGFLYANKSKICAIPTNEDSCNEIFSEKTETYNEYPPEYNHAQEIVDAITFEAAKGYPHEFRERNTFQVS